MNYHMYRLVKCNNLYLYYLGESFKCCNATLNVVNCGCLLVSFKFIVQLLILYEGTQSHTLILIHQEVWVLIPGEDEIMRIKGEKTYKISAAWRKEYRQA